MHASPIVCVCVCVQHFYYYCQQQQQPQLAYPDIQSTNPPYAQTHTQLHTDAHSLTFHIIFHIQMLSLPLAHTPSSKHTHTRIFPLIIIFIKFCPTVGSLVLSCSHLWPVMTAVTVTVAIDLSHCADCAPHTHTRSLYHALANAGCSFTVVAVFSVLLCLCFSLPVCCTDIYL